MSAPDLPKLLACIRQALEELRLAEMAAAVEKELCGDAPEGDTRLALLWRLIEPQITARRARSVSRRIRAAKLPAPRSLDAFDFGFQPKLDRDRVMELATLDFVRRGQNLLVAGMSGTGKSHICIALGYLACSHGIRTRYTTSADMLADLQAALASDDLHRALAAYVRPQLLIIDEVGLERPESVAVPDAQLFYKVIRPRHEDASATIITSNVDWKKWGDYLGDPIASVAILDRLIEHGHLITINGPSYRAARHKKLNRRSNDATSERPSPPGTTSKSPARRPSTSSKKPRKDP